ncbi:DUF3265 domain-containing protein [Vibrio fluvialis]|nr:DUF3265 domain-containing protein [Vibrio fluvialis]
MHNAWRFCYALVFSGYGVMRNLGSCVGCPLSGRSVNIRLDHSEFEL